MPLKFFKMKYLIQLIIGIVVFAFLISLFTANIGEKITNDMNGYSNMLGKKVIYKQDTLQVIDYSFLNSTVTLDNGTVINYEFAIKLDTISNGN